MSDTRITQLPSLPQQYIDPATDVMPIADVSASTTKKVTPKALVSAALGALDSPIAIASGGTGGSGCGCCREGRGCRGCIAADGDVPSAASTSA